MTWKIAIAWSALTLSAWNAMGESVASVLEQAAGALRSVKRLEYVEACYRTGEPGSAEPTRKTVVRVKQERTDDDNLPKFWARINVPRSNFTPESRQEVAFDGKFVTVVDHDRKTATRGEYVDAAPNAGSFLTVALFREFTQRDPLRPALASGSAVLTGREQVGGVPCDIIEVKQADGDHVRWAIGVDDHLPRRKTIVFQAGGSERTIVQEIISLDIDAPFKAEVFSPETPDGYVYHIDRGPQKLRFEPGTETPAQAPISVMYGVSDHAYAAEVRKAFGLDKLIAGSKTDLERVRRVCAMVHGLWQHSGNGHPRASDPVGILEEAKQGGRFSCVEYASVVSQCLNAIGIPAREVGLLTRDAETVLVGATHMVAEAYLPDRKVWVLVDAQENVVPSLGGEPLNAVQFQNALSGRVQDVSMRGETGGEGEPARYPLELSETFYFFRARLENRVGPNRPYTGALMLIPRGAEKPKAIQRNSPINGDRETRSLDVFYARPPGM